MNVILSYVWQRVNSGATQRDDHARMCAQCITVVLVKNLYVYKLYAYDGRMQDSGSGVYIILSKF